MVIVIKVGGASGNSFERVCEDLHSHPASVLVHGGSDATNQLCEDLGQPCKMVQSPSGHWSRLTDRRTLELFAQATALQNRLFVEQLQRRGIRAIGLSGLDGRVIQARRKPNTRVLVDGRTRIVRDQWTGKPTGVNRSLLRSLLTEGYLPVIAPIACSEVGEMLNVDGDRIAACIAASLQAEALVILTNVPGLCRDQHDSASRIPFISRGDLPLARNLAKGRMQKKIMATEEALVAGVPRVFISSSNREQPVQAALTGKGTVLGDALVQAKDTSSNVRVDS